MAQSHCLLSMQKVAIIKDGTPYEEALKTAKEIKPTENTI